MKNKISDALNKIEANNELKQSTLKYIDKERNRRDKKAYLFNFKRTVMPLCIILIVITFGIGYLYNQKDVTTSNLKIVSYISIDVNPSLELALNDNDEVIEINSYNEEGKAIKNKCNVIGEDYNSAINKIMNVKEMKKYLNVDADLTFTVTSKDEKKKQIILNELTNNSFYQEYNCLGYLSDYSQVSKAHKEHLSIGKYYVYILVQEYDKSITIKDCQHMSMRELHSLLNECQDNSHDGNGHKKGNQNTHQKKND